MYLAVPATVMEAFRFGSMMIGASILWLRLSYNTIWFSVLPVGKKTQCLQLIYGVDIVSTPCGYSFKPRPFQRCSCVARPLTKSGPNANTLASFDTSPTFNNHCGQKVPEITVSLGSARPSTSGSLFGYQTRLHHPRGADRRRCSQKMPLALF
jgi:hypothetical protein